MLLPQQMGWALPFSKQLNFFFSIQYICDFTVAFFLFQTEQLSHEVATHTTEIETGKSEIIELRRSVQGLEIELQSQLSMVRSIPSTSQITANTLSPSSLSVLPLF